VDVAEESQDICRVASREVWMKSEVTFSLPPEVAHEMELHKETLIRRSDDAPEKLQHRLQRYAENIVELRRFYATLFRIYKILDGTRPKNMVLLEACDALELDKSNSTFPMDAVTFAPVEDDVSSVRASLEKAQVNLDSAKISLQAFAQEVSCKWHTDLMNCTCGCKTETKTYVGVEPCWGPISDATKALEDCQGKLLGLRQSYWQREHGGAGWFPYLSCLLIACGTTSKEIEQLQSRQANLGRLLFDQRNALTREAAKMAKKITTVHCAMHVPPPEPPGSP
jgi:hypothetical protein